MADVKVTFSAAIGDLVDGINAIKSQVESLSDGFGGLGSMIEGISAVIGVAFAADALKNWVDNSAALGEQMENVAAKLGITAQEASQLAGMAKLSGTSFETLQMDMERFQVGLASAHEGTSRVAQGLAALGLNAREFIGVPIPEQLNLLAEATAKFADGSTKTTALMAAIGRGAAEMIPYLDRGKSGMQELADIMQRTGAVMTNEQAAAFAKTNEDIQEMSLAWEGLSNRIYSVVNPAIDSAIQEVTKLIEGMGVGEIRTALVSLSSVMVDIAVDIAKFCNEAGTAWKSLTDKFSGAQELLGPLERVNEAIQNLMNPFAVANPFGQAADKTVTDLQDANAKLDVEAAQWKKTLASMFESPAGGATLNVDAIRAQFGLLAEAAKQAAGAMSIGADTAAQEESKTVEESIATQISYIQAAEQKKAETYEADVKLHTMTEAQKVAATKAAVQDELSAILGLYEAEIAAGNLTAAEIGAIEEKMAKAQETADNKILNLNIQAAEKTVDGWDKAFGEINSAFESQISGLLKGTTSWAAAFKNAVSDLATDAIKHFADMALKATEYELLQITGVAAVEAAQQGADAAKGASAAATQLPTMIADAKSVFASVFAYLAPSMGPLAAAPAAAAGALAFAGGGFAEGAWELPSDVFAQLHAGEMVVPAGVTPFAQGALAAGGGAAPNITVNHTHNGMAQLSDIKNNADVIATIISNAMNRNPSVRPTF